jgi:hypothetical protein
MRTEKKILDSLIEFAQIDISKLSDKERSVWDYKLSYFYIGLAAPGKIIGRKYPWKPILEPFFKGQYQDTLFPAPHLERIRDRLRSALDQLLIQKTTSGLSVPFPSVKKSLVLTDQGYKISFAYYDEFLIHPDKKVTPVGDILVSRFLERFEGLPADVLKQCSVCGKWFVHVSKKERLYCSQKCGFKMAGIRRLERLKEDPEKYAAYLKKQRQAMKKIYKRGKKKQAS